GRTWAAKSSGSWVFFPTFRRWSIHRTAHHRGKAMAKGDCADCGGYDVEWMYKCHKHDVEYCRGCSCPYCDEDFLDSCDDDYCDDYYDTAYSEPPLYRVGQVAAMSDADLMAEARRQCSIHD